MTLAFEPDLTIYKSYIRIIYGVNARESLQSRRRLAAVRPKGQVALDAEGRVVGKGDMRAQTRRTLENIQQVLGSVGGVMADIVALTQYVTDIEQFMKTRDIRLEFFAEPFPVTTTVQVVRLYDRELLVEITAHAEIPRGRFRPPV